MFVQVVKHLTQNSLEGTESRTDSRRAETMGDQTEGDKTKLLLVIVSLPLKKRIKPSLSECLIGLWAVCVCVT